MPNKEQVLAIVRQQGPIIPNEVKKQVGGDNFIVGAILSELLSDGAIKISNTKIGGSPTYYVKGQEIKLLNLKKYLNQKDQRTVDLLKEKKILMDKEQEMLIRVSLRQIKDFAKQIDVNLRGETVLFWKWYLTSREEAEQLIRKRLRGSIQPQKKDLHKETKKETIQNKENTIKKEEQEKKEQPKTKEFFETKDNQNTLNQEPIKRDEFSEQLHKFFSEKNIKVLDETIIRKNSEIELKVKIPSTIGAMEYYCKAKNKKKCNDGDLSSAYLKGQSKKLPILFITTGDVTKKAKEMLSEEFKGLVLKQI